MNRVKTVSYIFPLLPDCDGGKPRECGKETVADPRDTLGRRRRGGTAVGEWSKVWIWVAWSLKRKSGRGKRNERERTLRKESVEWSVEWWRVESRVLFVSNPQANAKRDRFESVRRDRAVWWVGVRRGG